MSECTWTRTFQSTLDTDETWDLMLHLPDGVTGSVDPASFTVAAGASQTVTVTVNVSGVEFDEWYFGELMLAPASASCAGGPPTHRGPAQPRATSPRWSTIETRRDAGSQLVTGLITVPTNDLTVEAFGLAKAAPVRHLVERGPDQRQRSHTMI